jgi:hypothetical protein
VLPTNDCDYSSTSNPHRRSHRRLRVRDNRQGAGGETPLSETRRGGIRHTVVQSLAIASPAAPELAPCPRDPVPGPAATAAALLFLPPALSLVHPTLYLPASIPVLLTPARNSASLPTTPPPPSPPDGDNDADDQRSVNTTMDPSSEDYRPRATQSTLLLSTPPTTVGGGVQNTASCRSRDHAATRQVPPHNHTSSSSSSAGDWRGGSRGGGGCRARRQRQKRQWRR